jgi:transketolase
VVCEEHTIIGGLATAVEEVVAENTPAKIACLGIRNRFGQSGEPADLLKEYSLTNADIEKAALSLIS